MPKYVYDNEKLAYVPAPEVASSEAETAAAKPKTKSNKLDINSPKLIKKLEKLVDQYVKLYTKFNKQEDAGTSTKITQYKLSKVNSEFFDTINAYYPSKNKIRKADQDLGLYGNIGTVSKYVKGWLKDIDNAKSGKGGLKVAKVPKSANTAKTKSSTSSGNKRTTTQMLKEFKDTKGNVKLPNKEEFALLLRSLKSARAKK